MGVVVIGYIRSASAASEPLSPFEGMASNSTSEAV